MYVIKHESYVKLKISQKIKKKLPKLAWEVIECLNSPRKKMNFSMVLFTLVLVVISYSLGNSQIWIIGIIGKWKVHDSPSDLKRIKEIFIYPRFNQKIRGTHQQVCNLTGSASRVVKGWLRTLQDDVKHLCALVPN